MKIASRSFIPGWIQAGFIAFAVGAGSAFGEVEFQVVDLGTLGGTTSEARGVNDHSQVVGWSQDADGRIQAFLWQSGSMTGLGLLPGGTGSVANAINNNGEITGKAYVSAANYHAFLYISNNLVDLGTFGGALSEGWAINDQINVTGWAYLPPGDPLWLKTFWWHNSQMVGIPPDQNKSCEGYGINQDGRIAGTTSVFSPNPRNWAYVWHDDNGNSSNDYGEMKLLGSLGVKDSTGEYSGALDINDAGQAVGWTDVGYIFAQPYHAFLVTPSGGHWKLPSNSSTDPTNLLMRDLGTLDTPEHVSLANSINNQSCIVGYSSTSSGTNQAFLWRNGTMLNLNLLIPADSGWVLTNANCINEYNAIVGSGLIHGQSHAFLLRPEGRITRIDPIFQQTGVWIYTNDQDEVITQIEQHVETQVLEWGGTWNTNADATNLFTVEYCDALQYHVWTPFVPTSQWPIIENVWTNNDFGAVSMRFFRVRAR